jgi:hypothetical protein
MLNYNKTCVMATGHTKTSIYSVMSRRFNNQSAWLKIKMADQRYAKKSHMEIHYNLIHFTICSSIKCEFMIVGEADFTIGQYGWKSNWSANVMHSFHLWNFAKNLIYRILKIHSCRLNFNPSAWLRMRMAPQNLVKICNVELKVIFRDILT